MSYPEHGFIPDGVNDIEMHKRFEQFNKNAQQMIEETIGNLEIDDPSFANIPFEISPASMFLEISDEQGTPVDERTFADLSAVEQGLILQMLADKLHIAPGEFLKRPADNNTDILKKRHTTSIEGVILDESIDTNGARQLVLMRLS